MTLPRPSRQIIQDTTTTTVPVKPQLDTKQLRPSDVFVFEPREDITAYEMAQILKALYEPAIHFKSYLTLPEIIQRHFQPKS